MDWRVARSILVLRDEINRAAPNRSRVSDGTIGDAAHASRDSDHNPWLVHQGVGVVRAVDITHDPRGGCDAGRLAAHLADLGRKGDKRVAYVIWGRRISNPSIQGGAWRPYTGSNPHTKHVHLSVSTDPHHFDSTKPWGITNLLGAAPTNLEETMFCRQGDDGEVVEHWQLKLRDLGYYGGQIDGKYGAVMAAAVLAARRAAGSDVKEGKAITAHAKRQLDLLWSRWAVESSPRFEQVKKRTERQNQRIQQLERMHREADADNAEPHIPQLQVSDTASR